MFKSILTAFFLFLSLLAIGQKQIPEPTDFLVNDYAHLMSQQEVDQLGRKLQDYALESSTQIVVVTEPSLEGEDPFEYSHRLAVAWGIGGGQYDNGWTNIPNITSTQPAVSSSAVPWATAA